MKKRSLWLVALAAVVACGACSEKEGKYSPKKEIEKVYRSTGSEEEHFNAATGVWERVSSVTTPKVLAETWDWEDGLLTKIVYNAEATAGGQEETLYFTYEKKRVSRIDGGNEFMTFVYKGKNLRRAELYDKEVNPGAPFTTYTFSYDGDKVSKIEVMSREMDSKGAAGVLQSRWAEWMQAATGWSPATAAVLSEAKGMTRETLSLTWSGDNVGSVQAENDFSTVRTVYTYDNKVNPFRHFLYTLNGYAGGETVFANANNVLKSVSKSVYPGSESKMEEETEVNYSYVYQNDWPVEKHQQSVFLPWGEESVRVIERVSYYYEYDD